MVCYKLLKSAEIVNTKRCQQQLTDLNRSLFEKRPEYRKRQHKIILLHDNVPSYTISWLVVNVQLESSTSSDIFTRPSSFRLPFVCIDESRTCWTTFGFVRRREKMARWKVHSKSERLLPPWYSQIARKMRKLYNKSWS